MFEVTRILLSRQFSVRDPGKARAKLEQLHKLVDEEPGDPVAWRETIAAAAIEAGKYPIAFA